MSYDLMDPAPCHDPTRRVEDQIHTLRYSECRPERLGQLVTGLPSINLSIRLPLRATPPFSRAVRPWQGVTI